ncbi:neck protein [Tenacibaculum phage PTm1]|uniref:Neck protein n=2 Tax=Shirahamavirus PTm1 TaxID=2846435 RepID=A0A5S9EQG9_9CAUD|nr:neck protein [Tenacibaculum phage PTm1]BBI90394.1 neck protein [Tenacibaculum phage PTm1]BBI90702.1 neck protein [Tenacibaculum phage PTm5]
MAKQIGNKIKFENLTPDDIDFLNIINDNVTSSNSLPFDVPIDQVLRITIRSLKWFWYWYEDATQESTLYIPFTEIQEKQKVSKAGNVDLLLPEGIEGVFDVKPVGGSNFTSIAKSLRYPLLNALRNTYASSYGGANGGMSGFRSQYGQGSFSTVDSTLQMYELSQYKTMSQRGYRFSFNKNSRILRLMTGSIGGGIVCQAFERLEPQLMYGDQLFEDYVTAKVEEALGKIVSTFNFELPGGVTINYDEIKSNGKERAEKIEEDIKNSNNTDLMLSI